MTLKRCAWFGIDLCKYTTGCKSSGFDQADKHVKHLCVWNGSRQVLQTILGQNSSSGPWSELIPPALFTYLRPSRVSLPVFCPSVMAATTPIDRFLNLNFWSLENKFLLASCGNVVPSCVAHSLVDFLQNQPQSHIPTRCSSPAFSSRGLAEDPPWPGGASARPILGKHVCMIADHETRLRPWIKTALHPPTPHLHLHQCDIHFHRQDQSRRQPLNGWNGEIHQSKGRTCFRRTLLQREPAMWGPPAAVKWRATGPAAGRGTSREFFEFFKCTKDSLHVWQRDFSFLFACAPETNCFPLQTPVTSHNKDVSG